MENTSSQLLSKLTKAEIIDEIYIALTTQGFSANKKEILAIIELFFDQIKDALIQKKVIELRGFGTFELKMRKGREKARNPRTGETLCVDSHYVASFRPGKELKDSVWSL
ncbi:MAG: HU family DNA-binding protein [Spirochaetia bacterium]